MKCSMDACRWFMVRSDGAEFCFATLRACDGFLEQAKREVDELTPGSPEIADDVNETEVQR